ncbi:DUF5999 family protein [Streptomyces sp. NPDC051130]|uniref:DUF5999 family protein n=1 Tax=Streptomyces sp. NPDC051130 TaxID=3157223 RepID=UPI00342084A8
MCRHQIPCPSADAADRGAAHCPVRQPEHSRPLLGNSVVLFEDTAGRPGDGHVVAPHCAGHALIAALSAAVSPEGSR